MTKRRILITSDQATLCDTQPTKPCSDCPWSRKAVRGWLGPLTAEGWVAAAHGEAEILCHVFAGPQCAGAAIYRANVLKRTRGDQLKLPSDTKRVFARHTEFIEYHKNIKG